MEVFLLIFLLRLIVPLFILPFPLLGGLLALLLDYFDFTILSYFNSESNQYQLIDKVLDFYYLTLEAYVVLRWKNKLIRGLALGFYVYRIFGILLFELLQQGFLLVIFPNLFEILFLYYLIFLDVFKKEYFKSVKDKVIFSLPLFILFIYKLYQEYSLHIFTQEKWLGVEFIRKLLKQFFN
ncbi:hypothetical protein C4577_03780 [Candidatus Parcubacteria bacterium]|nr:MAG: hypothetical protein C4577_03780 [Candidatus Parcubacteria bacterium]